MSHHTHSLSLACFTNREAAPLLAPPMAGMRHNKTTLFHIDLVYCWSVVGKVYRKPEVVGRKLVVTTASPWSSIIIPMTFAEDRDTGLESSMIVFVKERVSSNSSCLSN